MSKVTLTTYFCDECEQEIKKYKIFRDPDKKEFCSIGCRVIYSRKSFGGKRIKPLTNALKSLRESEKL